MYYLLDKDGTRLTDDDGDGDYLPAVGKMDADEWAAEGGEVCEVRRFNQKQGY